MSVRQFPIINMILAVFYFVLLVARYDAPQSPQLHLTRLLFEVAHCEDGPMSFVGREWLFRELEAVRTFFKWIILLTLIESLL